MRSAIARELVGETAVPLIRAGVRVATCWDISAVHRLLFGGWRSDPTRVWAQLYGVFDGLTAYRGAHA